LSVAASIQSSSCRGCRVSRSRSQQTCIAEAGTMAAGGIFGGIARSSLRSVLRDPAELARQTTIVGGAFNLPIDFVWRAPEWWTP
jgi:hypothetical protein